MNCLTIRWIIYVSKNLPDTFNQASFPGDDGGLGACGGSVINSKWIVTALHCVVESLDVQSFEDLVVVPADKTFVIVGDHNLNDRDETDITK